MPVTLEWYDVALRLALALGAGIILGFNRGEHGKPAGLRTMILVSLAAAVAMILANLMLATRGKTADSFVQLDMMRLPLGILTGIGFIGAGAIIKKGDLVIGVTTAASVWFMTVIGLALGAGQIGLGLASLGLGLLVLWGIGHLEGKLKQERSATLTVACDESQPAGNTEQFVRELVHSSRCRILSCGVAYGASGAERLVRCEVRWMARPYDTQPPPFLRQISRQPGVTAVRWSC